MKNDFHKNKDSINHVPLLMYAILVLFYLT